MKLYEINQEIEKALAECIDPETGEIKDLSKIEDLELKKADKVKSIALYILNLEADEREIDIQLKKFLSLKKSVKGQIDRLKAYLQLNTNGEDFKFPEVKVTYRKSVETVITDKEEFERYCKRHKDLCKVKLEPNKEAVRAAIESGVKVKGAELVEKKNIQVK